MPMLVATPARATLQVDDAGQICPPSSALLPDAINRAWATCRTCAIMPAASGQGADWMSESAGKVALVARLALTPPGIA
jgi:hypothetical protein